MINLNDQISFIAIRTDTKSLNKGELSWIGKPKAPENTGEYVILEYTPQGLWGIIWFDNTLYSITSITPDVSVLYQVDQSQFPPDHPDDWFIEYSDDASEAILYTMTRFAIEFFRDEPPLWSSGLIFSQWVCLALLSISIPMAIYFFGKYHLSKYLTHKLLSPITEGM